MCGVGGGGGWIWIWIWRPIFRLTGQLHWGLMAVSMISISAKPCRMMHSRAQALSSVAAGGRSGGSRKVTRCGSCLPSESNHEARTALIFYSIRTSL